MKKWGAELVWEERLVVEGVESLRSDLDLWSYGAWSGSSKDCLGLALTVKSYKKALFEKVGQSQEGVQYQVTQTERREDEFHG